MNLAQIRRAIEAESDDQSYIIAHMDNFINEALLDIAERVRFPKLIQDAVLIIGVGNRTHTLPDDYHHNLFECWNLQTEDWCKILHSMKDLHKVFRHADVRSYDNQLETIDSYNSEAVKGDITHVSINDNQMVFLPFPDQQENRLHVKYYRKPPLLILPDDTPFFIPDNHHRSLIVSYVMMKGLPLYNEPVQEDRRMWARAQRYRAEYELGIEQLNAFLPHAPYKNPEITRTRIWF